eukprot:Skav223872  [mRNA]  locus=scaffold1226:259759:262786:- [translate_table: standard]
MEYCVVRLVCQFDIPRDCKPHGELDTIFDLQVMFMMGFMLAILTGVHMPDRFSYLFCFKWPRPRGIVFLLVMAVSGPVWGSLDTIDSLSKISFTSSFFEKSFLNVLIGLAFGVPVNFRAQTPLAIRATAGHGTVTHGTIMAAVQLSIHVPRFRLLEPQHAEALLPLGTVVDLRNPG